MEQVVTDDICVLLVDDHRLVLEGVRTLLRPNGGVRVIATATSGPEALAQLRAHPGIGVALVDLHMPIMPGIELIGHIREQFPRVRVLALSMAYDVASVQEVLAAGGVGYLLKNLLGPELVTAIRRVAAGNTYFSPEVASLLLDQLPRQAQPANVQAARLTPRETEILQLIAREKSNLDIADQLNISERTVETHRKNIFTKTGCKSAVGLVQYALREKLIVL
ncbi:response regulator transcription factor [Hymenobacter antarcticus]|uniref:Response regulator transcription factor n=1 Tax=Hymenobacter antarcticus TaxID=486270 RepID=A0ABP7PYT4_9BACT